jgi:saccharopine dehydrogenase-like NADP-dependent oxidoreductase
LTGKLAVGVLGAGGTVAAAHGLGKTEALEVDARGGLAQAIAGLDVLVNAASYRINLEAMRARLGAGCHYIDLGGLYRLTGRQFELDSEFARAGLLAILQACIDPDDLFPELERLGTTFEVEQREVARA